MDRTNHSVFIDESGDPNIDIDKLGSSNYYVIAAVIIDEDKVPQIVSAMDRRWPNHELKGANIRKRRIQSILEFISSLDFQYMVIVINLCNIRRDTGLRFKRSFIKFTHKFMYDSIHNAFKNVSLYADEHGSQEFMNQCRRYFERMETKPLLVYAPLPNQNQFRFQFANSKDVRPIQLADFIANTYLKLLTDRNSRQAITPIENKLLTYRMWPLDRYIGKKISMPDDLAYEIACISYDFAKDYIDKNLQDDDLDTTLAVEICYRLISLMESNPDEFITKSKLARLISYLSKDEVTPNKVAILIGKLRTAGVPICSSPRGYKLFFQASDLQKYIDKVNSTVDPYIQRLGVFREAILAKTTQQYDILANDRHPAIRRYLGL